MKKEKKIKEIEIDTLWDMFFRCFPPDMENLSTITPDQAYRLLKCFIHKLETYDQKPTKTK